MNFQKKIRIGTRRSVLARSQAAIVADAICSHCPGLQAELVTIVTSGDRTEEPLQPIGGKGLFTAELEAALRSGDIDLAVHSAKDLPAAMPADLTIAAVPDRQDPRDALITPGGVAIEDLPAGAVVGTSSLRRRAQLLAIRSDLEVIAMRGNLDTRLRKVLEEQDPQVSAVIVAMAGLSRSGLAGLYAEHVHPLSVENFVPAAGQGALVLQTLAMSASIARLVSVVDDPASRQALLAERAVLQALGASCRSCLAVHISPALPRWRGIAMVARPDGADMVRLEVGSASPAETATRLIEELRSHSAAELLCD